MQAEIVNVGNTDATLNEIEYRVEVAREAGAVLRDGPEPPHLGAGSTHDEIVIPSGAFHLRALTMSLNFQDIPRFDGKHMVVRGDVYYTDPLGVERHTAFERFFVPERRHPLTRRFVKAATPDTEYEYED